jgi:hypothetical protein
MASPTTHAAESVPAWPPHGRERLVGTDLHLVGLSATGLPGADLRNATFSSLTAWPTDFDPVAAGARLARAGEAGVREDPRRP